MIFSKEKKMKFEETLIEGCFKIIPNYSKDERGAFIKIFNENEYAKALLNVQLKEQYYSISKPGVLRGMHFQLPPMDHTKIVTCLSGEVLDVVIDLRKTSKTYKKCISFILNEDNRHCLYIPKGLAHGFYVLGNKDALMLYNTETVYDSALDSGIKWSTIDFKWPLPSVPIVSYKDSNLISLNDFNSPF